MENKDNALVSEEVQVLYTHYLHDIDQAKKLQWQVTQYLFVIQGIIVSFKDEFNFECYPIIASIGISILTWVVVYMYRIDIKRYRDRKEALKELFTDPIKSKLKQQITPNPLDLFWIVTILIIILELSVILLMI